MTNKQTEQILQSEGLTDYKQINPQQDITISNWVRFKCMYGCNLYGKCACCPPTVPAVNECRKMINEYKSAVIIHFPIFSQTKDEEFETASKILEAERKLFLAGYYKVFAIPHLAAYNFCGKFNYENPCEKCTYKMKSRPSPEAMGIDVFQTTRDAGYSIEVVQNKECAMNRFSIILIE